MPTSAFTHPLIYLAQENGWSWLLMDADGRPSGSEDFDARVHDCVSFEEAVATALGVPETSLPTGGCSRFLTPAGGTAFLIREGDTHALLLRPDRVSQDEAGELALSAAHELANALSAISGWAQLGLDEPSKMREALMTVETAAASAQRIARDVLSFREDGVHESCDAAAVCRDVASLLHPIALRHDVRVQTETPNVAWTAAHRAAVFRVVWNLALNATQVQPTGGLVRLTCERIGDTIRISVADHGPGIPKGAEERIFDSHYSERPGGTGLGLATVRRTLSQVGGTVSVANHELGAVFDVTPTPGRRRRRTGERCRVGAAPPKTPGRRRRRRGSGAD